MIYIYMNIELFIVVSESCDPWINKSTFTQISDVIKFTEKCLFVFLQYILHNGRGHTHMYSRYSLYISAIPDKSELQ